MQIFLLCKVYIYIHIYISIYIYILTADIKGIKYTDVNKMKTDNSKQGGLFNVD